MVATLQSRRDALEAKIAEKTAELKALCLQEADLTGVLPPETPLLPGEPPPTIRKRVGTSFSFPESLINKVNSEDNITNLELECKVQTNIAEAALTLANDLTATKAVRRKHRLMYRQSQRTLAELQTRLTLLQQGRHQTIKPPQQIKKKPRPNTVDHTHLLRELSNGSWPGKGIEGYEDDLRQFSSLQRSSGTSQSSNSPRLSARDVPIGLPDHMTITSSLSQPNIQELRQSEESVKKTERRAVARRQWDTQSAGGTLLPNQTYPDSHQPNLNRAHSLGSVESQKQQEKEWYETSLDSAPSPPLRTSSRLPTSVRLQYHMKEMQIRDAVNRSLNSPRPHPTLTRAVRTTPVEEMNHHIHSMHTPPVARHLTVESNELRVLENYTPPKHSRYFDNTENFRLEEGRRFVSGSPLPQRPRANSTSERMMHFEAHRVARAAPTRTQYDTLRQDGVNPVQYQYVRREQEEMAKVNNHQHKFDPPASGRPELIAHGYGNMDVQRTQNDTRLQYNPDLQNHRVQEPTRLQFNSSPIKNHYHNENSPGTMRHNPEPRIIHNAENRQSIDPNRMSQNPEPAKVQYYPETRQIAEPVRVQYHPEVRNNTTRVQYDTEHRTKLDPRVQYTPENHQIYEPTRIQYNPEIRQNNEPSGNQYNSQVHPNPELIRAQYHAENRANPEPARIQYNPDNLTPTVESRVERPRHLNVTPNELQRPSDAVCIEIPDEVDSGGMRRMHDGAKTPTQPYYHGAAPPAQTPPTPGMPEIHPPHAVTHDEITFDTVVPFESPQNHTVVQAGIWQPYREVTKPFEMSDFYKYSTKFRPARQTPPAPEIKSPRDGAKVMGVYQPLRPMTCQPVERRPPPTPPQSP